MKLQLEVDIQYKLDMNTGRINVYLNKKKVGQIIKDKKDSLWFYRPKAGKNFDGPKSDGLEWIQYQLEGKIVIDDCHIPNKRRS